MQKPSRAINTELQSSAIKKVEHPQDGEKIFSSFFPKPF